LNGCRAFLPGRPSLSNALETLDPSEQETAVMIKLKRAYEEPSADDGFRVLVERLWPRGVTKEKARLDLWLKELAPSPELRQWYGDDLAKWSEFQKRYRAELKEKKDGLKLLKGKSVDGNVTLVYAARDQEHNSALVLRKVLESTK
jgi:uncharacterized protein YeaO (DUF488 family)